MKIVENVVKGTINCGTGMLAWNVAKRFVPPTSNPAIKALYFAGVFGISQAVMDITSQCIEKDIASFKASIAEAKEEIKKKKEKEVID